MKTNASSTFGQWLKHRRRALDLTQDALATRIDCTASTLQKIEQGVRRPSRVLAEQLVDALGVSLDERPQVLRLARTTELDPSLDRIGNPTSSGSLHPSQMSSVPLLLTKIVPPLPPPTVARMRLVTQLNTVQGGRTTLVVAPAGWGKTTSLTTWIAQLPPKAYTVAWVALDAEDTDVLRLLRYIIAAFQRQQPLLCGAALQLLNTPQPSLTAVLTLIINDVLSYDRLLTLVLDDYHVVQAPAIHQAIIYLIEHLPTNLHLLLASREDPPLPLARLRTRLQVHEIRATDLRFTQNEAVAFFNNVMGLSLPEEEVAALEQRTEGWIAGLQLAALALRERSDHNAFIRSFTGSHRLVLDYLTEEVLVGLPSHLYEFLLQTSILNRFCGLLCDAVLNVTEQGGGDGYSQLILAELEQANLFLVPLDEERVWYRFHHLFGAVLQERLRRGVPLNKRQLLHSRAATWFEGQGLTVEAIHHACRASQWERAAALIEQIGADLFESGAVEQLQAMLAALPCSVQQKHPRLVYWQALCARQVYNVVDARMLFRQAAEGFAAVADEVSRGESLIYAADCDRMLGAYADAHQALAEALACPLTPARRAAAMFSRAFEVLVAGDWAGAVAALHLTLDLIEQSGDPHILYELIPNFSALILLLPQGMLCARRARRLIVRQPIPELSLLRATELFLDGTEHFVAGELAVAGHAFRQAMQVHEQLGALSQLRFETMVWYVHSAALLGDFATADRLMDGLIELLEQPELATYRQLWGAFQLAMQGWLRWLAGRYADARRCADAAEALANSNEWAIVDRVRRLLRALIRMVDRDWTAAEHLLHAAYADQQQFRDAWLFGDPGLMLAYVYIHQGREPDALALLATVLTEHQQQASPTLLIMIGAPIVVPLLQLAVARNINAPFAAQALSVFPLQIQQQHRAARLNDAPHPTAADPDMLTARELEVLRLIADGASNHDIAERLVISLATVKKHINNIFAKLHAKSRIHALKHARERRLL